MKFSTQKQFIDIQSKNVTNQLIWTHHLKFAKMLICGTFSIFLIKVSSWSIPTRWLLLISQKESMIYASYEIKSTTTTHDPTYELKMITILWSIIITSWWDLFTLYNTIKYCKHVIIIPCLSVYAQSIRLWNDRWNTIENNNIYISSWKCWIAIYFWKYNILYLIA